MTIKIEKSTIFLAVGNVFISVRVRTLEHCWRKGTEFKNDCNLHQQVRFEANVFLSDDITHLNQLYYFIRSRYQNFPRGWLSESFLAAIRKPRADGNDQKNALEQQPGPGAWRTILHNWISVSTHIWERQKMDHAGV